MSWALRSAPPGGAVTDRRSLTPVTSVEGQSNTASERLRRIEAVTDTTLNNLGVEDLLDELLERVRDILEVDTAAVLLLDPETGDLVATASVGLAEEVRQGVRIPVGLGFAGRVAADLAPVVIDEIEGSIVRSRILEQRGIHSLLGVPLISEGRLVGVLHVGSLVPRHFEPDEVDLLQLVADRVAVSVDARRSSVDRAAAWSLQRSLIPARLPSVSGMQMAARYLPAGEGGVGGDWYDVFVLPDGRIGVVMGDVIGRGLGAAVVMGRVRSALRAYALDHSDPADVLTRLDRKIHHFEAGKMTTVLYVVVDPMLTTFEVTSAGHPLPIMVEPDGEPAMVPAVVDPPLGVIGGIRRRSTRLSLPAGAVLATYTDGLIERRGESIDTGIERLRSTLRCDTPDAVCSVVINELVGEGRVADDTALLVLRRDDPSGEPLSLLVPADAAELAGVRAAIRWWLAPLDVDEEARMCVQLAVGEAMANTIEHAYGPGGGTVEVNLAQSGDTVVATVRDTGRWRGARGEARGRGLRIMDACAEEVTLDRTDSGTTVRLRVGMTRRAAS